uniref:PHB domain-containing protein n=1 Tax=Macrostomum lignano TaxID=282301 RepID=A0A1I8FQK8_9PLAT
HPTRLLVTFLDSDAKGRRGLLKAFANSSCRKLRLRQCGHSWPRYSLVMRAQTGDQVTYAEDFIYDSFLLSDIKPLLIWKQRGMTADDVAACLLPLGAASSRSSSSSFSRRTAAPPPRAPRMTKERMAMKVAVRSRSPAKRLQRSFSLVPERLAVGGKGGGSGGGLFRKSASRMQLCEAVLQVLIVGLVVATFPFSLLLCLKVVAQYERAVIFRLGRIRSSEASGPGMIFLLPGIRLSMKLVDLRTMTFDVPTQEVLTKDSVTVAVEAVDLRPVMSVVNVEDCSRSTKLLAQTTLRQRPWHGQSSTSCGRPDESTLLMQRLLDPPPTHGASKVERVEIKDVRLPTQLQRAMAAEAEAAREARAKVIAAEGEQKASKALKAAAIELSECGVALQLRYLQTLCSISAEKNSTIIFRCPSRCCRCSRPSSSSRRRSPPMILTPRHRLPVPG